MSASAHLLLAAVLLGGSGEDTASCRSCHSGAIRGLAASAHGSFLRAPPAEGTCSSCHKDTAEHVRSAALAGRAVPPPPVEAASCASCHPREAYAPRLAAHPFRRVPGRPPRPLASQERQDPAAPPPGEERPDGQEKETKEAAWEVSGLLAAGVRGVSVSGSKARFRQDLNLEEGFRLLEAELRGAGPHGEGWIDRFLLAARDLDDPDQSLRAEASRSGAWRGRATHRRTRYVYDPGGDYHVFDLTRRHGTASLDVHAGRDLTLFGHLDRIERDGVVVTRRIGNPNVQPLTSVPDVRGPRSLTADLAELGATARGRGFSVTAAGQWHEENARDLRFFQRDSPVNPAFPESEEFQTDWSLRGPGARASARADLLEDGSLVLETAIMARRLRRRTVTRGEAQGYDIDRFTSRTDAHSRGRGRTWLWDGSLAAHPTEDLALLLDLRWVDHAEDQDLTLVEVITWPDLGTTITRDGSGTFKTRQRTAEGSLAAELQVHRALLLRAGYGLAVERLRLPDLQPANGDFRSGTIRSHGFLAGAVWKPHRLWTASADFRGFGTGDTQLHEVTPDLGRAVKARVRHGTQARFAEVFVAHRHAENDLSSTRQDATTAGVAAVLFLGEDLHLHASQSVTWLDSVTLTNFYFAPDPTPVPTRVGFHGTTYTSALGGGWTFLPRWTWTADGTFVSSDGDMDIRLFHLLLDLVFRASPSWELGAAGRAVHYREELPGPSPRGYDALVGLLYARWSF